MVSVATRLASSNMVLPLRWPDVAKHFLSLRWLQNVACATSAYDTLSYAFGTSAALLPGSSDHHTRACGSVFELYGNLIPDAGQPPPMPGIPSMPKKSSSPPDAAAPVARSKHFSNSTEKVPPGLWRPAPTAGSAAAFLPTLGKAKLLTAATDVDSSAMQSAAAATAPAVRRIARDNNAVAPQMVPPSPPTDPRSKVKRKPNEDCLLRQKQAR